MKFCRKSFVDWQKMCTLASMTGVLDPSLCCLTEFRPLCRPAELVSV